MRRPLVELVEDLFARVGEGCPAAFDAAASRYAGLTIEARFGDEAFGVVLGARGPAARLTIDAASVRVASSLAVLRDLMVGDVELVSALRDERLRVFGAPSDLVRLDEFVQSLVAGAARTSGTGRLFDEFDERVDDEVRTSAGYSNQTEGLMT